MHDLRAYANLTFQAAAAEYLASRKADMKPRSHNELANNIKQAGRFFDRLRLCDIYIGHITQYQESRLKNKGGMWAKPAKGSVINHEISALQSILKRAVGDDHLPLWNRIDPFYRAILTPPAQSVQTLTDEEEMLLFQVASQDPDLELAYWVASITNNSGAAGKKLRTLRLRDLSLNARIPFFEVREEMAKNQYRVRKVVLNDTALRQMTRCLKRAVEMGATEPDHYLFPGADKVTKRVDPTKPASESWLKRPWAKLRERTGLKWIKPHHLRHQHITISMEAGQSVELIAKRVGHGSINMTRYYTHARQDSQLDAVKGIDPSARFGPQVIRNLRDGRKARKQF